VSPSPNHRSFKFTAASPSTCSFTASGIADASYNEATGLLTINESGFTGNLVVGSSPGCGSTIAAGDALNLAATYHVDTVDGFTFAANAINIG
jgi:hypothetical protein